ncbi:MAG: 3-phosphoglycerate dehydrogenase, partial [Firmicutes bacterium]|nr:3-phosphoglycerate dehydrogenase [Bacillota bacterium]
SLHVPLNDATKGMINKDTLALCKNGVNIINAARGELCCNHSIIEGLQSKKINRYVTDFPSGDLLGIENIVTIPHLGASTPEAEDNCAVMAAEEMCDFLDNGNIRNSVNFPNVRLERCNCGCSRATVIYKGALDIVAETAKLGIKVKRFAAGTKKEYGYAIFDYDTYAAPGQRGVCPSALTDVAGVVRVRIL